MKILSLQWSVLPANNYLEKEKETEWKKIEGLLFGFDLIVL